MADSDGAVHSKLSNNAGVAALVSTRISRSKLAEQSAYPAIRYQLISGPRDYTHDGASGIVEARYQIDCFDTTSEGSRALAEAVRSALSAQAGIWGSLTVQYSFLANERPFYEDDAELYRRSLDFLIGFLE